MPHSSTTAGSVSIFLSRISQYILQLSPFPPLRIHPSRIQYRVSTDADDIMAGIFLKKQEKIFTP